MEEIGSGVWKPRHKLGGNRRSFVTWPDVGSTMGSGVMKPRRRFGRRQRTRQSLADVGRSRDGVASEALAGSSITTTSADISSSEDFLEGIASELYRLSSFGGAHVLMLAHEGRFPSFWTSKQATGSVLSDISGLMLCPSEAFLQICRAALQRYQRLAEQRQVSEN
mmetsp:Transcript_100074/g.188418  ORF Transcript_100074/g.188418 Transcript_100074/m.188418 type:complete len:166 (-) Transcript_100074:2-499(-)